MYTTDAILALKFLTVSGEVTVFFAEHELVRIICKTDVFFIFSVP